MGRSRIVVLAVVLVTLSAGLVTGAMPDPPVDPDVQQRDQNPDPSHDPDDPTGGVASATVDAACDSVVNPVLSVAFSATGATGEDCLGADEILEDPGAGPSVPEVSPTFGVDVASATGGTARHGSRDAGDPVGTSGGLHVAEGGDGPVAPSDRPEAAWMVGAAASLLLAPVLWLYRRLSRDELLDNPVRRKAMDVVEDRPGATAADVAEEADVHYLTARYHLRKLEEFGELDRRRFDGRVRYFPNHGTWGRRRKELKDAVASPRRRSILEELLSAGELAAGELADRIGVAPSTASFHLKRLREAGVVDRRRDGREVRYRVDDEERAAVHNVVRS